MASKHLTRQMLGRITDRIRSRRKQMRLTQEQLAERCGCVPGYISEIETNKKQPSLDLIFNLASALETTASSLMEGVDREQEDGVRQTARDRFEELISNLEDLQASINEFRAAINPLLRE